MAHVLALRRRDPDPGVAVPTALGRTREMVFCWGNRADDVICGLLQRPDKSAWKQDGAGSQSSARQPDPALPAPAAREEASSGSVQVRLGLRRAGCVRCHPLGTPYPSLRPCISGAPGELRQLMSGS